MGPQSPQPSIHVIITTMIFVFLSWPYMVKASIHIGCMSGDMVVHVGYQWTERCANCTCTESGKVCDSKCPMEYNLYHEMVCAKWSSDNCCCEQLGCPLPDGSIIPVNERMPPDPAKPCHTCTCKGGYFTECYVTMCQTLKWPKCTLPQPAHTDFPVEAKHAEPLAKSISLTLGLGTRKQMTCACNGGLVAECHRSFQQKT